MSTPNVIQWSPGDALPAEPSVVVLPEMKWPITRDAYGVHQAQPDIGHTYVGTWLVRNHTPDKVVPAFYCSTPPDPDDLAAFLAIEARAHCLVLEDWQGGDLCGSDPDIDPPSYALHPEPCLDCQGTGAKNYIETDYGPRPPSPKSRIECEGCHGEGAFYISQVFILSGEPEHIADAISQCEEAGVACWVMDEYREGFEFRSDWYGRCISNHTNRLADALLLGQGGPTWAPASTSKARTLRTP